MADMPTFTRKTHARPYLMPIIVLATMVAAMVGIVWMSARLAARADARPGTPGVPYANMPALAPIGVRVDRYLDLPEAAKGPAIDPAKGYRTQKLGDGLFMITEGV